MSENLPEILILDQRIDTAELMEATDPAIREQIREITFALIGAGEPLP